MAGGQEKWYFTKEQLQNSPSRKCSLDADKELAYRQQAANLIQDMGQRLQVSQLCINTAIVYMHRFYAFHSFTHFHRNAIASAALFLAAKVEEQPRKLEYVIKVAHVCLHRGEGVNALTTEQYQEQAQDLVFNENVLLQTLGFDVAIDHPHTHVVRTCHLVKAPKDLAQTSYFMASNSLHLTTMCLQYRPTVVACFCIHLASKWSNWQIPQSNEGKHWFSYVDPSVTTELLERLTAEFLHIFDKCPSRLKKKMKTMSNSGSSPHAGAPAPVTPFDKKHLQTVSKTDDFDQSFDKEYERERKRQTGPSMPGAYVPAAASTSSATAAPAPPPPQKIDYTVYREKRDREERERRHQVLQQRAEKAERLENRQDRPEARPDRPEARPERSEVKVERPEIKVERPEVKVERPEVKVERPEVKVERPEVRADRAEGRQERSDGRLERSECRLERQDVKLERQDVKQERPDRPEARPDRPAVHQARPGSTQAPPHQRPSSQHHHKPHHAWPHHKQPHHKPEHRHHRPQQPPNPETAQVQRSVPLETPQPQAQVQRTRPPSLFSPENTTPSVAAASAAPRRPQVPQSRPKPDMRPPAPSTSQTHPLQEPKTQSPQKKRSDPSTAIRDMQPPAILSPFSSPPPKDEKSQKEKQRSRTQSNSSEPELVPVLKKIEETPGYENVIRDSQRGNAIKAKPLEPKIERKPDPMPSRSLNGIETDPTLVSNLLKESLAKPAPITVATEKKPAIVEVKKEPIPSSIPPAPPEVVVVPPALETHPIETTSEQHKHKKEKKKKEKHKHKDRDKSKEERKKHKKDKDREKKHKEDKQRTTEPVPQPLPIENPEGSLRITIPRDKLPSPGLKIKIPKERLAAPPPPPQQGLKIKISKDFIDTSRKRPGVNDSGPPQKMPRQNGAQHTGHKVGNWNMPNHNHNINHNHSHNNHQNHHMRPSFRPPMPPYYMMQPPPMQQMYYGMGMDGYFYGAPMFGGPPPQVPPRAPPPPLPAMPPPEVPPPPPD